MAYPFEFSVERLSGLQEPPLLVLMAILYLQELSFQLPLRGTKREHSAAHAGIYSSHGQLLDLTWERKQVVEMQHDILVNNLKTAKHSVCFWCVCL